MKCERRHCSGELVEKMDKIGRITFTCRDCEVNKAGLCRDCLGPLPSRRHMRCETCATRQRRACDLAIHKAAYRDPERREQLLAAKRDRRSNPEVRARDVEYSRRYRAAHPRGPRTALDRLYALAHSRKYRQDPAVRERELQWHRERRKDPEYRARQNARNNERRRKRYAEQRAAA